MLNSDNLTHHICIKDSRMHVNRKPSFLSKSLILITDTAYDQLLAVFRRLVPIPTALSESDGYRLNIEKLRKNVASMGLSVVFASNPRNPTGQAIEGEELQDLVNMGSEGVTIILDEFYS